MDSSGAYASAVTARAPNARIVLGRFHVQRLAHEALDKLLRARRPELGIGAFAAGTRLPIARERDHDLAMGRRATARGAGGQARSAAHLGSAPARPAPATVVGEPSSGSAERVETTADGRRPTADS
jgi:hypothetical protein